MTGWMADQAEEWGGRPIARTVVAAGPRQRVRLTGVLGSVRAHHPPVGCSPRQNSAGPLRPSAASWLEADLDDGTGHLTLRWAGRSAIPGVGPGAMIEIEGTAMAGGARLLVLNPLYRLLAR